MHRLIAISTVFLIACSPAPTLVLTAPVDGATVCGTPLFIDVDLTNYKLIEFADTEVVAGEGHIDIKLNGQNRWMTFDPPAEIPQNDDGVYLVEVYLVDATHLPIEPNVTDSATITIDNGLCD